MGYYIKPHGELLLRACRRLIALNGWEQALATFLKPLVGSRQLDSLRAEDIIMLKGEGPFQHGTDQHRELLYLLLSFMAGCGGDASKVPVCIGYRKHPTLNIDEVVQRVLGTRVFMPSMADLKLDPRVRTNGIPALLATLFRRIAAVARDEQRIYNAIRTHLSDVAYRASRKMPYTQHEKSLLLNYGNAGVDDGPGRTAAERAENRAPKIGIAPHDSDIVHQIWSEVMAVTQPGPYSDYFNVVSNGDKQELIYAVGPHAGPLVFHRGFEVAWNVFTELEFEGSEQFEWDRDSQLTAARESGVAFNEVDRPFDKATPLKVGTLASEQLPFTFDEVDIQPEVDDTAGTIKIDEYVWRDAWIERRLTSNNGNTPSDYAHSRCLLQKDWGGGRIGMTDLSTVRMYDPAGSKEFLGDREISRPVHKKATVFVPTGPNNALEEKQVDLSVLFKGHGSMEFVPAFTEYSQLPREALFKERIDEEDLVAMQLGLTREQAKQGRIPIRITLNYSLITQTLGESALAIGRESVLAMARAITSRQKQKES
jgi:hypothetical protein